MGVVLLAAVSLVWTRHSQRLPGRSQYVGPALSATLASAEPALTATGTGPGHGYGYLAQAPEPRLGGG